MKERSRIPSSMREINGWYWTSGWLFGLNYSIISLNCPGSTLRSVSSSRIYWKDYTCTLLLPLRSYRINTSRSRLREFLLAYSAICLKIPRFKFSSTLCIESYLFIGSGFLSCRCLRSTSRDTFYSIGLVMLNLSISGFKKTRNSRTDSGLILMPIYFSPITRSLR